MPSTIGGALARDSALLVLDSVDQKKKDEKRRAQQKNFRGKIRLSKGQKKRGGIRLTPGLYENREKKGSDSKKEKKEMATVLVRANGNFSRTSDELKKKNTCFIAREGGESRYQTKR